MFSFQRMDKKPSWRNPKMNTGYLDKIFDTPIGKMTESNWNIIVWMFGYLEDHHWRDAFRVGNLDEESNIEDLQALVKGVYEHYSMDIDEKLQKLLDLESWSDSYE